MRSSSRGATGIVAVFPLLASLSCSATSETGTASARTATSEPPAQTGASAVVGSSAAADAPSTGSAPIASAPSAAAGAPEPISLPTIEKVCKAAPCSGPMSRIAVLRSGEKIVRYLHHGDIRRCSHPPSVYFDASGAEVGTIPMKPIQRGSDDEKKIDADHTKFAAGGKPVEETDCSGKVRAAR